MSRASSLRLYITSRILLAPLMVWLATTIVFILIQAAPGDVVDVKLGPNAPEALKDSMRVQMGLDQPMYIQYFRYLNQLLHFDLGSSSYTQGQPITQVIGEFFPATVELTVCGMIIAALVGLTVGSIAASRPNTPIDTGSRLFGIITYALPMYWFGMILQLLFAVKLGWFPQGTRFPLTQTAPTGPTGLYVLDSLLHLNFAQFFTSVHHLALPSLTLGLLISGVFERIVRVNLRQTLKSDYVEAARARGISEFRILTAHALKNAMIPVITILGLTFAAMLGGAVLTEVTFDWPGLGNRLYIAISQRDADMVQGLMVFFATIVVVVSILIDILNAYVDPRIRY
ncbi:MAG: ABC transporter permease [Leptolyngbya foveolarum]|uniref:ABC transporter permease n=1 Tax=Leptolyngbya foveolarum TaxID=47253 RepID=A0A2W4TZK1_9CYAN|nr:MAG: ABC transporter permease [Leptolyngbya foveolarum]